MSLKPFVECAGRRAYYISISAPSEAVLPTVAEPFAAMLWSARTASAEEMSAVAARLIEAGCTYFVAGGEECEAWHDAADHAFLELNLGGEEYDRRFLMTTWHAGEPVDEVAFHLGMCAAPAARPGRVYSDLLVIQYGGDEALGTQLRAAVAGYTAQT